MSLTFRFAFIIFAAACTFRSRSPRSPKWPEPLDVHYFPDYNAYRREGRGAVGAQITSLHCYFFYF
jgi:hypothetical protein